MRAPVPLADRPAPPALVPAVVRALAVMDLVARRREPLPMAHVAAELDLPKSSVHGLCNTLLSYGYLRRAANGALQIGPGVMGLAEAFVASTDVAHEFAALWHDAAPDETVILSLLNGVEVVYVGVRGGTRPLGLAFNVGMRLPANLAATGKAMLAFQDPAAVRARFAGRALAALAQPPQGWEALERELALTRRRGHSIDDEGVRKGVYCIAAPVFDASGQAVAGLGVCLNKSMVDAGSRARQRELVCDAARALSLRLGAAPARAEAGPVAPRRARSRR
jgi:IclR family transcriptional regulator, blcABC operon repressor